MLKFSGEYLWLSGTLLVASAIFVLGCSDDDKGCETGILREVQCGAANAGTQIQACVDKEWYITTLCEDAQGNVISGTDTWTDEHCEAGQTRAAVCGSKNQGLKPQVCRQNQWVDTNSCFLGPDGGGFHFPGETTQPPGGDPKPPNPATCSVLTDEDIAGGKVLPENTCYKVERSLNLSEGQLIAKAGVTITFDYGTSLNVYHAGRLITEGTAANKVTFRGATAEAGYWEGINFENTGSGANSLSHVIVRDAGGTHAAVWIHDDNTQLNIEHALFQNNRNTALQVHGQNARMAVSDTEFIGNELPIDIPANLVAQLAPDLRFENNDDNHVRTGGNINTSATWPVLTVPYNIAAIITLEPNVKLTLQPNTTLLFDADMGISVGPGIFVADGSQNQPIVMKASDASFMGQGFWRGVWFNDSESNQNRLEHTQILKAGYSQWHGSHEGSRGALVISGMSNVKLNHIHIEDSGSEGLRIAQYLGKPTVDPCTNITYANNVGNDLEIRQDPIHTCQ